MRTIISELIEALKDQKEFFGDLMLDRNVLPDITSFLESAGKKTATNSNNKISFTAPPPASNELSTNNFQSQPEVQIKSIPGCDSAVNLDELNIAMNNCGLCRLGSKRGKLVFGKGNPSADIMVVGEAPGADEDVQGEPFVGRAGQLLTDILKAINLSRDDIYITNIVKCRPPANRNPMPDEMAQCMPCLKKQIEIIKPKAILCLGLVAANGVLSLKQTLSKMRGNVYQLGSARAMVTYHPAALLRNPEWKRATWEDVQKFRKLYDDIMTGKI